MLLFVGGTFWDDFVCIFWRRLDSSAREILIYLLFINPNSLINFAIFATKSSRSYVVELIFFVAVLAVIGALFVLYQLNWSSIGWFSENSEPAGLAGASLFAGFTTLGISLARFSHGAG